MAADNDKRWVLVATILASGTVFLNGSVVNVALPVIGRQLSAGLSGLQWVIDGYTLTLGALLIVGGALGDRYGRRRLMVIGLIGYGITSLLCAVAFSATWLIGARVLQGVAGALLVPESLAILRAVYTDPEQRGQAIGTWSGWSGVSSVLGPLLGGWLVSTLSWRWAFYISLPLVAVAIWMMLRFVPESRGEGGQGRLDYVGTLLGIAGLTGVVFALIEGPVNGWTNPLVLGALVAGVAALVAFPFVEARVREPLVPLTLFASRNFTGANLTTLGMYAALSGTMFFLVIYIQNVMGYTPLQAGLMTAPTSILLFVLSPIFGRLAATRGPRLFMAAGPLTTAAGLVILLRVRPDSNIWTSVIPAIVVFGLGLSATVAPLTNTVMSSVSSRRSGVAAAVNNVVSRIAGLLAIAGLGVVVAVTFHAELSRQTAGLTLSPAAQRQLQAVANDPTGSVSLGGLPPDAQAAARAAYTRSFHTAMIGCAVLAAAGGTVAALTVRREAAVADGEEEA